MVCTLVQLFQACSLPAYPLPACPCPPAVLGYAVEQSGSDIPNLGYAATFPMVTIAKILIAQLLLLLL